MPEMLAVVEEFKKKKREGIVRVVETGRRVFFDRCVFDRKDNYPSVGEIVNLVYTSTDRYPIIPLRLDRLRKRED